MIRWKKKGGISLYGILGNNLIGQIDFLGMKNWPFTEAVGNGLLNAITDPFRRDWRTIGGLGLRGGAVLDEIGRDNMLAWQLITDPMPLIEKMIEVDQKVNDGMVACAKMEFLYQKDIQFSKALGGMGKFSGSAFLSEQLYKYLLVKGLVKPGWKSATPFGMMMALLQMQGFLERVTSSIRSIDGNYPHASEALGGAKVLYHFFKGEGLHKRMEYWQKYYELTANEFRQFAEDRLCVCVNGKRLPRSHKTMPQFYMIPFK